MQSHARARAQRGLWGREGWRGCVNWDYGKAPDTGASRREHYMVSETGKGLIGVVAVSATTSQPRRPRKQCLRRGSPALV